MAERGQCNRSSIEGGIFGAGPVEPRPSSRGAPPQRAQSVRSTLFSDDGTWSEQGRPQQQRLRPEDQPVAGIMKQQAAEACAGDTVTHLGFIPSMRPKTADVNRSSVEGGIFGNEQERANTSSTVPRLDFPLRATRTERPRPGLAAPGTCAVSSRCQQRRPKPLFDRGRHFRPRPVGCAQPAARTARRPGSAAGAVRRPRRRPQSQRLLGAKRHLWLIFCEIARLSLSAAAVRNHSLRRSRAGSHMARVPFPEGAIMGTHGPQRASSHKPPGLGLRFVSSHCSACIQIASRVDLKESVVDSGSFRMCHVFHAG